MLELELKMSGMVRWETIYSVQCRMNGNSDGDWQLDETTHTVTLAEESQLNSAKWTLICSSTAWLTATSSVVFWLKAAQRTQQCLPHAPPTHTHALVYSRFIMMKTVVVRANSQVYGKRWVTHPLVTHPTSLQSVLLWSKFMKTVVVRANSQMILQNCKTSEPIDTDRMQEAMPHSCLWHTILHTICVGSDVL